MVLNINHIKINVLVLIENVICVILSKQNNVFGGFTKMGWSKLIDDQTIAYHKDTHALLYRILRSKNAEKAEIFKVRDTKKKRFAVQSCEGYMCCFGDGGIDLCLENNCNDTSSYPDSWTHYQRGSYLYSFNVKQRGYLNGGEDNALFKVEEVEVYQCDST